MMSNIDKEKAMDSLYFDILKVIENKNGSVVVAILVRHFIEISQDNLISKDKFLQNMNEAWEHYARICIQKEA